MSDFSSDNDSITEGATVIVREDEENASEIIFEEDIGGFVGPYMYEPEEDTDDGERDVGDEPDQEIADWRRFCSPDTISEWCKCDSCQIMPSEDECHCCQETMRVTDKLREAESVTGTLPACITEHPGFHAVCLDPWSLQTAWLGYRQQYGGKAFEGPEDTKYRHIAYRQLVRWCWGKIGRNNRVTLPSCAVSCIRAHYPPPDSDYVFKGFKKSLEDDLPDLM